MCYITLFRIIHGRVRNFRQWIEYVGHDHLHHRMATALGGRTQSVLFIYILSICLGINAMLLPLAHMEEAVLLLGQGALIFLLVSILERKARAVDSNAVPDADGSAAGVPSLRSEPSISELEPHGSSFK